MAAGGAHPEEHGWLPCTLSPLLEGPCSVPGRLSLLPYSLFNESNPAILKIFSNMVLMQGAMIMLQERAVEKPTRFLPRIHYILFIWNMVRMPCRRKGSPRP